MMKKFMTDTVQIDPSRISTRSDSLYGEVTVFHDVVIASEIVQRYDDGLAYKPADELEAYKWTVDGRWVKAGAHPDTPVIMDRRDINGRTVNPRFVKNLKDHKTGRTNRRGVRADIEMFNDKTPKATLDDMKSGKLQDVSIGFFYEADETPGEVMDGVCKGDSYDYVQRHLTHDHLAVAINNGRCPSPYCGLGADAIEDMMAGDPFAGFKDFAACTTSISKKNPELSEESVRKICGKLKAENEEKKDMIDEKQREKVKVAVTAFIDALIPAQLPQHYWLSDVPPTDEEVKAFFKLSDATWESMLPDEKQLLKQHVQTLAPQDIEDKEWWQLINWKDEDMIEAYDKLSDEFKTKITADGLCPSCEDKEEEDGGEDEVVEQEKPTDEAEDTEMQESTDSSTEKKSKNLDPYTVLDRYKKVMDRKN